VSVQTAALPPTNPFADLLESSTASATPNDDTANDDLDDQVVLDSSAAANNPFLASVAAAAAGGHNGSGGLNGAVAMDTSGDPWSCRQNDGRYCVVCIRKRFWNNNFWSEISRSSGFLAYVGLQHLLQSNVAVVFANRAVYS